MPLQSLAGDLWLLTRDNVSKPQMPLQLLINEKALAKFASLTEVFAYCMVNQIWSSRSTLYAQQSSHGNVLQAVKKALGETINSEVSGKKLDEAVVEYVGEAALFQLHIKTTLLAIKVIDEPEQWNPRVSITHTT